MTPSLVPRANATLHAGGMSIDYVRCGNGDTVVVLHAGGSEGESVQQLIDGLALDHRVIVPVLPADESFPIALDNLLEGIGACSVGLVAVGAIGRLAQEFVASRPGRVVSLVTL
jgi:pimeloyl-ACP methyl ester carboxylesterase